MCVSSPRDPGSAGSVVLGGLVAVVAADEAHTVMRSIGLLRCRCGQRHYGIVLRRPEYRCWLFVFDGFAASPDAGWRLSVDPMAAWRRPLWGRPAAPQSCLGCCAHICVDVFCEHLRQQLEAASRVAGCRYSHAPVGVAAGETFKGLWIA